MVTWLQRYFPQVACLSQKTNAKRKLTSVNGNLAPAVLSPGGMFVSENKREKKVDIYHFHISLAYAHLGVLEATVQQHGIRLVGKLAPCKGCLQAKRIRAATLLHMTARARVPMALVNTDTAGPYPESLGGSRYVIMFVDSASRLQRPHRTRDMSTPAILAVVKHFMAVMEVPGVLRTDNGSEYTNRTFTEYCDGLGIHRGLNAPYTP